jgi:hypothetical protein
MATILPKQQYFLTKPDPLTGEPVGGGYKCGACGLEGLTYGEPHYAFAGHLCEPHPDGAEVTSYARAAGELVTRNEVVEERPEGYETYEPAATEVGQAEGGEHEKLPEFAQPYATETNEVPVEQSVVDKPFVL